MSHLFISYSTQNSGYALRLAAKLREEGFDVWIDNARLRSSDNWWEIIVKALSNCAAVVVVMTPEARQSRWVQREVTLADNWRKPTFPILLSGENWEIFVLTQYEDVRSGDLPPTEFYDDLGQLAPRQSRQGVDVTNTPFEATVDDTAMRQEIRDEIAKPPPADLTPAAPMPPLPAFEEVIEEPPPNPYFAQERVTERFGEAAPLEPVAVDEPPLAPVPLAPDESLPEDKLFSPSPLVERQPGGEVSSEPKDEVLPLRQTLDSDTFDIYVKRYAALETAPAEPAALPRRRFYQSGYAVIAVVVLVLAVALLMPRSSSPSSSSSTRTPTPTWTPTWAVTPTNKPAAELFQLSATWTPTPTWTVTPLAAVVLPTAGALPTANTTAAAIPGQIAYVSDIDGDNEIFLMNADGSNPIQLTFNAADDFSPTWSPDGQRIAFISDRDGVQQIYIVNLSTSVSAVLPRQPSPWTINGYRGLAWSPGGQEIAFSSYPNPSYLYTINLLGSVRRLTSDENADGNPAWSPDGTQIAYHSLKTGSFEIYVMDSRGNLLRQMTTLARFTLAPSWSPDGARLAFTSDSKIYTQDAVFERNRNLLSDQRDYSPNWSPDGNWIVFGSERDGNGEIYVMDRFGGNARRLTTTSAREDEPTWRPSTS